jgi:hypothetical protein
LIEPRSDPDELTTQVKQLIKSNDEIGLDDLLRPLATHITTDIHSEHFPDFRQPILAQDVESRLEEYSKTVDSLALGMATGCRWAKEPLRIWKDCLEIVAQPSSRKTNLNDEQVISRSLRLYPALMIFFAAGMGALVAKKHDTLKFLFYEPRVPFDTFSGGPSWDWKEPALALTPWEILARIKYKLIGGSGEYLPHFKAPLSCFLFKRLESSILPLLNSPQDYSALFNDFEYLLGLCNFGLIFQGVEKRNEVDAHVGRFATGEGALQFLEQKREELKDKGEEWLPLKSGIISGPLSNCRGIVKLYHKEVELFYINMRWPVIVTRLNDDQSHSR